MYSKFKELVAKKDRSELRRFVENASADELSDSLTAKICNAEAPRILGELLSGFTDSESSQTKRRKVVEAVLKSLQNAKATTSHVDSIVYRIIVDFSQYAKPDLVKIVEFCQARIRLNDDDFQSWKDILPAALESLEDEKYINYKGNEVSGQEYKTLVVKSICDSPWETATLISFAKMFGEMSLDKDGHELVMRGLCDKLPDVELNEIPPLVHQLLRLQSNQDGRLVLGTLQKYFAKMYAAADDSQTAESLEEIGVVSQKEIEETESTVLYHIYQAAQVNHAKFKDFVASLKKVTNAPEYILDPFLMAVLLMVSNIYDDQIFEILKNAMCRKIHDDEKRRNSAWLRSVLSDDWRIIDIVEQVIANSNKDRHVVLKALVELAFVLMSGERRAKDEDSQLYDIGIRIIQRLIRKRHEIGASVLQKLTYTIVAHGSTISQYTECLSYICRKLTLIVLDAEVWVTTLLEQLLAIPRDAATQVLHAILPLMPVSHTIRDCLVLVLQKGLYRPGTRQIAVIGFLLLLKNLKINHLNALSQSGQSSSASASSSTSILTQVTLERRALSTRSNARCNAALCHEVLSILRRCFRYEVDVRLHLYKGLYDGVSMNPELSDYVMDMLIAHFKVYYETDMDVKPPLKFHLCSDIHGPEAVLQEPIGDLIFVMQRIYIKMASKDSSSLDEVSMILESLCKRMTQTELEHLNLDDRTDLLDNVPKSQQKLHSLTLMITVYEALMAYKIGSWSQESSNVAQSIYSLFKRYTELVEFSKRVAKPKKSEGKTKKDKDANETTANKKAGRSGGVKLPNTVMDLDTIHKMLCLLYEPSVPWAAKEQAAFLKKRMDFHHYILQTAIQLFHNARSLKNADIQRHQEAHLKDYLEIGELLFKQIVSELDIIRNFDQQTGVLGLECFKELCDLICTSFPSELSRFLSRTCEIEASRGLAVQILGLVSPLQELMESYFQEDIDDDGIQKKIPAILLDTMMMLLRKVSFENAEVNTTFAWLKNLAQKTEVQPSIAISFVQLLSMIEEREAENGQTIDELCVELCGKLGTIDKSDVSIAEGFKCLTEISAVQAHPVLSAAIKSKLNNAAWLLGRLKAEQCIASAPGSGNETEREKLREKERSLCRQLSYIAKTLQTLANAEIEPGQNTDATFKNLQQLYKLISDLAKYFLAKSTAQNPAFQSVKFIQLVELAGKSLQLTAYNLMTYTADNQSHRRGKTDNHAQRNKVIKETRAIPNVVREIEIFHTDIMKLSRKTAVPLENYVKQSTTRDFRIKNAELLEGLEQLDVSLQVITQNSTRARTPHFDETSNQNDSDDSESGEPPAKSSKTESSPTNNPIDC